jgi:hypothetical protein
MTVMRAHTAVRVAAGFALGALVAVWSLGRAQPKRASEVSVSAAPEAAQAPTAGAADSEVTARAARVGQLSRQAESLFQANLLAHFQPPKDLPARFSGNAIEAALHSSIVAAGVDAEILGTDCSEYPCIAKGRTRSAADLQKIKDQFFDQPVYSADLKQLSRGRGDDPREYRFAATVYPSTDPRLGEIFASFTRRLGVARLGPGSLRPNAPPFPPDTLGSDRAMAAAAEQR